jgi:hypothetical protein
MFFRVETYLARNLFVNLRWDAAGFGISDHSSHITWNGVGVFGYDLSSRATLYAGYRWMNINYSPTGWRQCKSYHVRSRHGIRVQVLMGYRSRSTNHRV